MLAMFNLFKSLFGGGKPITPQAYMEQYKKAKQPHTLIDVRTPMEFRSGHIPGAINIDVQSLHSQLGKVSKDNPVIVYCLSGSRSGQAASMLERAGHTEVYNLGAIGAWRAAGLPLE